MVLATGSEKQFQLYNPLFEKVVFLPNVKRLRKTLVTVNKHNLLTRLQAGWKPGAAWQ